MPGNRSVAAALSAFFATLLIMLAAAPAPAADLQERLDAKQSKLDEVKEHKGVLTTTIARYRREIDRLTGEVAAIRGREAAAAERLAAKQAELDAAVVDLGLAQERLEQIRGQLKRALVALRERLVAMYESGTPDAIAIIVSSSDIDDLATRTEYLERIRGMDAAVVDRVQDLRDEARSLVAELRDTKLTIESARDAIAAEERALSATRSSLQSRQQQLVGARGDREAALARVSDHEHHLHGEVSAIQSDLVAQLAATGAAPLPAGPIREGSGGLIWPVDGVLTSGFGGRDIGAGWRHHAGIDIAAPEGTPIRSAAAGTVVIQQSEAESGGYGNFSCVDHGGGLSTCYAHMSSVAASAGASVGAGEVIGYVGNTGYSFGAHLHFEVRIYGQATDPMGYL